MNSQPLPPHGGANPGPRPAVLPPEAVLSAQRASAVNAQLVAEALRTTGIYRCRVTDFFSPAQQQLLNLVADPTRLVPTDRGDTGEVHRLNVGRRVSLYDNRLPERTGDPLDELLLATVRETRLVSLLSEVAGMPLATCHILTNGLARDGEMGPHLDLASNFNLENFVLLVHETAEGFEGGDLVVMHPSGEKAYRLQPGDLIIGDPRIPHRVDKVTAGLRITTALFLEPALVESAEIRDRHHAERTLGVVRRMAANLLRYKQDVRDRFFS